MKFLYTENDTEFRRWTGNLFKTFIQSGEMKLDPHPDVFLTTSTALRANPEIVKSNVPLILVHNEAWTNYWPPCDADRFDAIIGCCPVPFKADNFIQYPYYVVHYNDSIDKLLEKRKKLLEKSKTKFCCFVTSNDYCGARNMVLKRRDLFEALNSRMWVDSAGRVRNNVGYYAPTENFIEWISDYKFMICLENTKQNPGYLTEKPFTPWFAGTVPIYDGACKSDLYSNAFVDASEDIPSIVHRVSQIDGDDTTYNIMRNADLVEDISDRFSLKTFEDEFRKKVLI